MGAAYAEGGVLGGGGENKYLTNKVDLNIKLKISNKHKYFV